MSVVLCFHFKLHLGTDLLTFTAKPSLVYNTKCQQCPFLLFKQNTKESQYISLPYKLVSCSLFPSSGTRKAIREQQSLCLQYIFIYRACIRPGFNITSEHAWNPYESSSHLPSVISLLIYPHFPLCTIPSEIDPHLHSSTV